MGTVESTLLRVVGAAVAPVLTAWLGKRRNKRERANLLADLVDTGILDDVGLRRTKRRIDELVDTVYERIRPLIDKRFADLPEHELRAALDAVADTFDAADLSDAALFADDLQAAQLSTRLRQQLPSMPVRAGLSAAAEQVYNLIFDECCVCLIQLVIQLRPFQARVAVEMLDRLTDVSAALGQVLARLPVTSLDAPAGTDHDTQFEARYLAHVIATLDRLELFGVDVRRFRLQTPLSVAYISLAVSGEAARGPRRSLRWNPGKLRHDRSYFEDASVRVESALGSARRILIRGEAGSGKTTLVQWIAVTAARSGFSGELSEWNGCVPYVVRLRHYVGLPLPKPEELLSGVADPLAGLLPPGWVHRRLADGAVLCVDGVDEVPEGQRRAVREWLRGLLAVYPELRVVVTSRPAAAAARWLHAEGFAVANLERMGPSDVRALIRHWHEAVRSGGDLPCEPHQLAGHEQRLLVQLDGSAHLQALAASPLLCAMLCALNLDRDSRLPRNRIDIYQAAMDMLLERRDAQRGVRSTLPDLTSRHQVQLLQQVAWWLTLNGRTELAREEALHQIRQRLAGMQVPDAAESVLDHLVQRSGVLREPVPDRIDFVHRTFQEYLAAREAAEQGHDGALVGQAHLDTWRETIVLAAGLANAPVRRSLLTGLLDRASNETKQSRHLRLLAAACLETAPAVEPAELLQRIRDGVQKLLPPRSVKESRSLAGVGEPLLRELPAEPGQLTEAQATALIRTAALINGPGSLDFLAGFALDVRPRVQRELISVWPYFDPKEYAQNVLAEAPLDSGHVLVFDLALLPWLAFLKNHKSTTISLHHMVKLERLRDVPGLVSLGLSGGFSGQLSELEVHGLLVDVSLSSPQKNVSLDSLGGLANLSQLSLNSFPEGQDFSPLKWLVNLKSLGLFNCGLVNVDFVSCLPSLVDVYLNSLGRVDVSLLGSLKDLRNFSFGGSLEPVGGLLALVEAVPRVRSLDLFGSGWLSEALPLRKLVELEYLYLGGTEVKDLSSLATLSSLRRLEIGVRGETIDLRPLASLPGLRDLEVLFSCVDLAPLAGRKLAVRLRAGAKAIGAVPLGIRIRRHR
ncbi:NACHT domain-containing protein [Solwaraspora sp. WMMA2101]|uniref:NACHT domain-containing protein n=1 Tax=Solwaraspora sp. WMMA2101 TaxID=3404124 RepID=UPI003B95786B